MQELEGPARAALGWLEHHGDLDGDGYLEYQRRNTTSGLENQCWKDSWNSIVHPDGRLASLPRATCEPQGYAYDAPPADRPVGPHLLGRPGPGRPAGRRRRGPQGPLQPGLLGL